MSDIEGISSAILNAYVGDTIAPVRDRLASAEEAYAVQQATVKAWLGDGRRLVGRKIGLTSKAVQQQLGVDEPDYGVIFADMVLPDASLIAPHAIKQPRVEAELAFVLSRDLPTSGVTPEAVMAATDYISPALEICGSRIAGWDIKIRDTVADNASAGMVVLGGPRLNLTLDELPDVAVQLAHNGAVVVEGRGEACLGNPAVAVAWLAEALGRYGEQLKAGDIVMSGALGRMVAAVPGDHFKASFGQFGAVSVSFGR